MPVRLQNIFAPPFYDAAADGAVFRRRKDYVIRVCYRI